MERCDASILAGGGGDVRCGECRAGGRHAGSAVSPRQLHGGIEHLHVNWEGFYIGGQGGYGSSDANFAGSNATMLAALLDHTVIQEMQVSQWNLGLGGQSTRSSAFGAFAGYNSQWEDVVVGLEVNYMHGKFGGASRRDQGTRQRLGVVRHVIPRRCRRFTASISISDLATFALAPPTRRAASCPICLAASRSAKPTSARTVTVYDAVAPAKAGPSHR